MAPLQQSQIDGANIFRREGHYWTLSYGGVLVRLKDSKGLRDIARLIEHAGSRLHVFELTWMASAAAKDSPDKIERARVAVTMRIRNAVERIENEHYALGRHLSRSIETGRFCCYEPETPTEWML